MPRGADAFLQASLAGTTEELAPDTTPLRERERRAAPSQRPGVLSSRAGDEVYGNDRCRPSGGPVFGSDFMGPVTERVGVGGRGPLCPLGPQATPHPRLLEHPRLELPTTKR
jgi:hypothetical protein